MDLAALLPSAVGLLLSPLVVATVVILLGSPDGVRLASACALGWAAAVAAGVGVAVLVGEQIPRGSGTAAGSDHVQSVVAVVAGVVLLLLAAVQWVRRRRPDGSPASAGWSHAVDALGPRRSALAGAFWFVSSPKNLVFVLTAGLVLGDAEPSPLQGVLAVLGVVVVGSAGAAAPIVVAVVAGRHADAPLTAVRRWIERYGALLVVGVLLVLGVVQLATGVVGLAD